MPDRIVEQLRKDIITGKYRRGDRFVENDLAETFEASRGSVRSALQTLEGEGLIAILDNGRKMVTGFAEKDARDLYELRWLLENRAVEIAWERRTMAFAPMLKVLKRIEQSSKEPPEETDWFALDLDFHAALIKAADSKPLLTAWEMTRPMMYALLELNTTTDYKEDYIEEFLEKHRRLSEMIISADKRLYEVLKDHIITGYDIAEGVIRHYRSLA